MGKMLFVGGRVLPYQDTHASKPGERTEISAAERDVMSHFVGISDADYLKALHSKPTPPAGGPDFQPEHGDVWNDAQTTIAAADDGIDDDADEATLLSGHYGHMAAFDDTDDPDEKTACLARATRCLTRALAARQGNRATGKMRARIHFQNA
jgi:hypothetical protein